MEKMNIHVKRIVNSEWLNRGARRSLEYNYAHYPDKRKTINLIMYALYKANFFLKLTPKTYGFAIRLRTLSDNEGLGFKYQVFAASSYCRKIVLSCGRMKMEDVPKEIMLMLKQVQNYKR